MNSRRLFSVAKPGPLGRTWHATCSGVVSTWGSAGGLSSSFRISLVSLYQSVPNTTLSSGTTGPWIRTLSSTYFRPSLMFFATPYVVSIMFCEPMNAVVLSTTRILRWLRRSGRRTLPRSGAIGSIGFQAIPASSSRFSISL